MLLLIVLCLLGGLGAIDEGFGQTYNKSKQSHLAWTMDGGSIIHYIGLKYLFQLDKIHI